MIIIDCTFKENGEWVLIDCTFKENGEWVLIDYKTDHDKIVRSFLLKVPGREPFFMLVPK